MPPRHAAALLSVLLLLPGAAAVSSDTSGWPPTWSRDWSQPGPQHRPLLIVHGLRPEQSELAGMSRYQDLGLGGIVCNVDFSNYLTSETNWQILARGLESCRAAGLRVWIYDESGYPSGTAGGHVLKGRPGLEAMELAFDTNRANPFVVRPAYEHTHACNNYHAARRAINLLHPEATTRFIEKTHEAYWQRFKKYFGKPIEAFFTDEPSLMAVNIGDLGEARKTVRVEDPIDPSVQALPCVPWVEDLPQLYRRRYREDLMPRRLSLFQGDAETDRQVRRQFWALVADLTAERYFGQIQQWCGQHRVASSGHTLHEEYPLVQVPLEGNALQALRRMDIPGLDLLCSMPHNVIYGSWLAAVLPSSAALAEGRRLVMTETSDFAEAIAGKGPAPLAHMRAATAWQAALGVTEFNLYYSPQGRTPEDYRAYTVFTGRLNALLREAQWDPDVLLYYPAYDLWADYRPVADKLTLESQPAAVQKTVQSFMRLGAELLTRQHAFALADHEMLASAKTRDGALWIGRHRFKAVVLPEGAAPPPATARILNRFARGGGAVLRDKPGSPASLSSLHRHGEAARLQPADGYVVLGRFARDGREILLLVNTGSSPYAGGLAVDNPRDWQTANPGDGRLGLAEVAGGRLKLSLPPCSALFLVGPRNAHP